MRPKIVNLNICFHADPLKEHTHYKEQGTQNSQLNSYRCCPILSIVEFNHSLNLYPYYRIKWSSRMHINILPQRFYPDVYKARILYNHPEKFLGSKILKRLPLCFFFDTPQAHSSKKQISLDLAVILQAGNLNNHRLIKDRILRHLDHFTSNHLHT